MLQSQLFGLVADVVAAHVLLHVTMIDGVPQLGVAQQVLRRLVGVAAFQCLEKSHAGAALAVEVFTLGKFLGGLTVVTGCFGVCAAVVEQFAHLVAAERERLPVARCFQYGYGAQEGAFGLGVLSESHLRGGHLREAYARLARVASRLVYFVGSEGVLERLLRFPLG